MKKIMVVFALLLFLVLISAQTTFASIDNEKANSNGVFQNKTISEFDFILELREKSDGELKELGLSQNEIEKVKSNYLEQELLKRSKLPEETLKAYGYNDKQIELLRSYNGESINQGSVFMALSGSCDGYFTSGTCNSTTIRLRYNWEWTIVPVIKMTDKVVVRWQAVKKGGTVADATVTYAKAEVKYYYLPTGAYASDKDTLYSGSGGSTVDYRSFNIPMIKDDNYWAKKGKVLITLSSSEAGFNFKYADVGGAYGHKIISCTIGFTIPANSMYSLIKLTPTTKVNQETDNDGRIYPSGTVNNYH